MTNEQFDNCSRLKLDHGMYFDFGRMSRDLATGLLVVEDAAERYRWTAKLLGQGDVSDFRGVVHAVANHNMYSNIQGQISASQPNLQSIPKWTRKYLVAPVGHKLISLDIGSAEARAIVAVSGDSVLREAILNDPYVALSEQVATQTGIVIPRDYSKKLFYGYFYGQTQWGVIATLGEAMLIESADEGEHVYQAIQGLFAEASTFLSRVADANKAFLQGKWTDVDVSGKTPAQRRSYVASSMVAAIAKQWAVNLVQEDPSIEVLEIPRDALWLSVPNTKTDSQVLAIGRRTLIDAIQQLHFDGFPTNDAKLLTMKELGEKNHD